MQRSTTPDAAADAAPRDALTVLPLALPPPLALRIWGALPCDARLRCREVCPAWRDALAEPRLWTELDLMCAEVSRTGEYVTPALLLAAAARADGRLERLFVKFAWLTHQEALQPALLAVIVANADSLRLLRFENASFRCFNATFSALLDAVPRQCVVEADVFAVECADAVPMLRNEHPFESLRLRSLNIGYNVERHDTDVIAFAAELAAHPSLRELKLARFPLDTFAAFDAVVDAALTLRLTKLDFDDCDANPASAVALSRMLRGDALRELTWWTYRRVGVLLDAHAAVLLADALRSNHTLTSFTLKDEGFWRIADAAVALLSALVGHPSLTSIMLWGSYDDNAAAAVGPLLGALVAADSPQLRRLWIEYALLGDAGLGPLVDALPRNTHLRELRLDSYAMSTTFARERLMPALTANTSLQEIFTNDRHANAFVAARTAAAAATSRA